MNTTLKTLQQNLTLDSNYFRYVVRLMIACSAVVVLYEFLHFKNGYWAAFSVIACVWPTLGLSVQRTKQRIIGTFFGMWLAILIAHTLGFKLAVIDILLPIFIFLTFYLRAYSYSLFVVFTTVVTVLFICLLSPGNWQIALTRFEMTVVGTLFAILATLFILPSRAGEILPTQLETAKDSIQQYYLALLKIYQSQQKNSPRAIQSKTFKNLQAVISTIQESNQEHRHSENARQEQSKTTTALEASYQGLLMLEVHTPSQIKEPSLQFLSEPINEILNNIIPLFKKSDPLQILALKTQLANLNTQIREQRITALKDLSTASIIFYEPVQWTIFIDTLQGLLNSLKNIESFV
jgi:uncharacterized membrane protein YccC